MKSYDAVVIGAGPAGSTAALILARAGWSVGIVEKTSFPRRKVCGEFISATSLPLLRELGVAGCFLAHAGPAIRQIGLYAGNTVLAADMPCPWDGLEAHGRAFGREHFDTLMLARATEAGAEIWQPWTLMRVEKAAKGFVCAAVSKHAGQTRELRAGIVIAAHGSWERGGLPTQRFRYPPRASDLFAFKAHFLNGDLQRDLMPLVIFPGGYGGAVQTDGGRTSFSCCIRRDYLERCRRQWRRPTAAAAVFAHIQASCRGVREAFACATLDRAWLSAGPIRPGIRTFGRDGIFAAGNAAGEAHPIVAEGISMAMQSAWLLCERLVAQKDAALSGRGIEEIGRDYEAGWRRNFSRRIHAAAGFAHLAMRPVTAAIVLALLKRAPGMLTLGAYLSGKAQPLSDFRIKGMIVNNCHRE